MDEFNKLPTDPEWLKKVGEVSEQATKELGCMVVLIAVQEDGKLALEISGIPDSGPLHDIAKDPPRLLANLAVICRLQDAKGMTGKKH